VVVSALIHFIVIFTVAFTIHRDRAPRWDGTRSSVDPARVDPARVDPARVDPPASTPPASTPPATAVRLNSPAMVTRRA